MHFPLVHFLNFGNLLYYFFRALGGPEDFAGISLLASLGALPSSLLGADPPSEYANPG